MKKILLIILGPTAVGKTTMAIDVARWLRSEIISADSRQMYRELKIGTATPSPEELLTVKHHFIGHLSITDKYNVSSFEKDVLEFLEVYFLNRSIAIMVGGSGLYIDAICQGIDQLPDADESIRISLRKELKEKGLDYLGQKLNALDPEYFLEVDLNNPNRIIRALEVCMITGQAYSSLRKKTSRKRPFDIIKIGLSRPKDELAELIHQRVDKMIRLGLVEEARNLLPYRDLNALNTVGYKEIFQYLSGKWSLETAIEKIKTNTRRYAKRQMTWFNKDPDIHWFHPGEEEEIRDFITGVLAEKSNDANS